MHLHLVTPADVYTLATLAKQTFFDTYATHNTPENMANYIKEHFSVDQLTTDLNNPNIDFYFSKKENEITGYVKLNYADAQTDIRDEKSIEIERIYILKEYKRQGIGRFFCDETIRLATEKGKSYIWLGVWEKNLNAIAFYEKLGFATFDKHIFDFAGEMQMDFLMKKEVDSL